MLSRALESRNTAVSSERNGRSSGTQNHCVPSYHRLSDSPIASSWKCGCWVGWDASQVPVPYIRLLFRSRSQLKTWNAERIPDSSLWLPLSAPRSSKTLSFTTKRDHPATATSAGRCPLLYPSLVRLKIPYRKPLYCISSIFHGEKFIDYNRVFKMAGLL